MNNSNLWDLQEYVDLLPLDRQQPFVELIALCRTHLPAGFQETYAKGFVHFTVPKALYPSGYHCKPSDPLPFLALACQKNYISMYHLGIYADPELLRWFQEAYPQFSKAKLNMGKSCIRFKNATDIPWRLIGELLEKFSPAQWIALYESKIK